VAISARKGVVTVRRGKGDRYRQVPLNTEVRDALDAWLARRTKLPHSDGPALFLSLKGQRLSARATDLTLRRLGNDADVELSAHTLRHTCLIRPVRAGTTSSSSPSSPATLDSRPLAATASPATPTGKPPWMRSPSTTDLRPDNRA